MSNGVAQEVYKNANDERQSKINDATKLYELASPGSIEQAKQDLKAALMAPRALMPEYTQALATPATASATETEAHSDAEAAGSSP